MSTLDTRTIRAKIIMGSKFIDSTLRHEQTEGVVEGVRNNGLRIQCTVFDEDDEVVDMGSISAAHCKIRESQWAGSAIFAQQDVDGLAIDNTVTKEEWEDGTKQHFEFIFPQDEMNFTAHGRMSKFWLAISVTDSLGYLNTIAAGVYLHHEANIDTGTPAPTPTDEYYTKAEVDAIFASLADIYSVAVRKDNAQVVSSSELEQFFENLDFPVYANLAAANAVLDLGDFYFDQSLNTLRMATG